MTAELSYVQLKTANDARVSEEVRVEQRRRSLLVLMRHYLEEEGFLDSAHMLSKEAGSYLGQWVLCDNIDLPTILQEYESYFFIKFKRLPRIAKKRVGGERPPAFSKSNSCSLPSLSGPSGGIDATVNIGRTREKLKQPSTAAVSIKMRPSSDGKKKDKKKTLSVSRSPTMSTATSDDLGLTGLSIGETKRDDSSTGSKVMNVRGMISDAIRKASEDIDRETPEAKLLKPLAGFAGYNREMRELAAVISRDIYSSNPGVRWDDIIGLDAAKRLVKEAVVYPIKYPQLFSGIMSPWKGLLLYGPPGTGKTMLAKAVATECNTTFFNISASTIVSKWRGDSEKLVRVLFELARFHAPSTIFMDELESIMGQRSGFGASGGEHEGSRRMKTELLVQMDGLAKSTDLVFVLAASNLPWELDHAMLRRLEKRILVDLPTEHARCAMFRHHLPPVVTPPPFSVTSDIDYEAVAKLTEGYSGSDIRLVCKEAAMKSVRLVFDQLEVLSTNQSQHSPDTRSAKQIKLEPVTTSAVVQAIGDTKPSARMLADRYLDWQKQYASV